MAADALVIQQGINSHGIELVVPNIPVSASEWLTGIGYDIKLLVMRFPKYRHSLNL